jgi:hypothetical protein
MSSLASLMLLWNAQMALRIKACYSNNSGFLGSPKAHLSQGSAEGLEAKTSAVFVSYLPE